MFVIRPLFSPTVRFDALWFQNKANVESMAIGALTTGLSVTLLYSKEYTLEYRPLKKTAEKMC